MPSTLSYENSIWLQQKSYVAGVDEVGRGCLAGPVVAAAVVFPSDHHIIPGIKDSKKTTLNQRRKLIPLIKQSCLFFQVCFISPDTINQHGIVASTLIAMAQALDSLPRLDHAFVDGIQKPASKHLPFSSIETIKKGDDLCYSIAAASIIAKVARDDYMTQLHSQFPLYHWDQNKGYGTLKHRLALIKHGPSPYHRTKFIRKIFANRDLLS